MKSFRGLTAKPRRAPAGHFLDTFSLTSSEARDYMEPSPIINSSKSTNDFLPAVPHEVDVIKSPGQRASIGPVRSIKPFRLLAFRGVCVVYEIWFSRPPDRRRSQSLFQNRLPEFFGGHIRGASRDASCGVPPKLEQPR